MAPAFPFQHLCLLFLHLPLCTLASAAPGKFAFFLDEDCEDASVINPSVNVPADTCLVISGALGIAIQEYPACSSGSGNVTFKMFKDTSCANPVNTDIQYQNCYFDGPNGVPAINFVCNDAAATATSTVQAGSSTIPVAAGGGGVHASPSTTSSSSGAASKPTAPSSNDAATTTSSSSNPSQTNTSVNSDSTTTTNDNKSSGISQRTQILLGVILPIGGIVVAVLAWWFPCKKSKKFRHYQRTHHYTHSQQQQQQQHPGQYNLMQHTPSPQRMWG